MSVVVMAWACSPEGQARRSLRRADRLIRKAEMLVPGLARVDTVWAERAVPVPVVRLDTVVVDRNLVVLDTVVVRSRQFSIRLLPGDTVRVEAECRPDTIHFAVPVEVVKTIECPPRRSRWEVWVFLVFLGLLSGFALGVRRR